MLKKTTLTLLAVSGPLIAQDFLDPLVVTAARVEQAASAAPYTTAYLDARFLGDTARRTLPEALQFTPGVLVQKTAHGHGSPFIRGFTGRQNLLLVDGIRTNNSTYRSGPVQYWNSIDPLAIDHIELIMSHGSVLCGPDAAGGTVNVFGKSSRFRNEAAGQVFHGGAAFYEFRSNGQGSHIGRLETDTGVGGKFGILLGVSAKEFGDIEDSAVGRMKNTGYPEQSFDLRLDWALTPESSITFAHYYLNQDNISRWHRTLDNPGWVRDSHIAAPGLWSANSYDQNRSLTYLRYAGENPQALAAVRRWSATLSYQTTDESEFQNRLPASLATSSSVLRQSNIGVKTTGIDLNLESPVGPGALAYGIDFYHDEVDSSGYRSDLFGGQRTESLPIADDSRYDLFGAYAQYLWHPVERLEITTGARYTHARARLGRFQDAVGLFQSDQSEHWNAAVGSLRGIYALNDCWDLYGGISQAFRAPNLDDLTGNLTARTATTALGSTDLDPEKFLTYEIGTRRLTHNSSLNFAVFYTDVSDQIVPTFINPSLATAVATNAADGYIYGVELEGAWRYHPQWMVSGFAAWQDGRTEIPRFVGSADTARKSPPRLLPLTASVALRWTAPSGKFWIESRVLSADREGRIDPVDQAADSQRIPTGGTPGYLATSVMAGWQASARLHLTGGIENLTDQNYRIHGSGQNEPGLNGILRAKILW